MSTRQSTDTTSNSGVSYPAGSGAATANSTVRGISITKDATATSISKLGVSGAFNGHAVEIHADKAVWDTVSNKYLLPGTDFNPGDMQRS